MAVREVLRMGALKLMQRSEEVAISELATLDGLIEDMFDTMDSLNGAGLAAPQIGEMKRLVIFGVDENPRYPDAESVPDRHTHIRYSGVDQHGEPVEREATGFHARVVQHECDHLDGVLYPMRIQDLRLFGFETEIVETVNGLQEVAEPTND